MDEMNKIKNRGDPILKITYSKYFNSYPSCQELAMKPYDITYFCLLGKLGFKYALPIVILNYQKNP